MQRVRLIFTVHLLTHQCSHQSQEEWIADKVQSAMLKVLVHTRGERLQEGRSSQEIVAKV